MRHVGTLLITSWLGGCSILYNPSNIATQQDGAPDSPADAPIDGDPTMITVTGVRPAAITEGQGANGSRSAVLVIEGTNFVAANTTVTITPSAPVTKTPMLTVDNTKLEVSASGTLIAVPVMVAVDARPAATGLKAGDSIPVDVTVTQDAAGVPLMKTLSGTLRIGGLDELEGGAMTIPGGGAERVYSVVNLTGNLASSGTEPLVIRSTSSLTIGAFSVNGSAQTGGPGGGTGGNSGSALSAYTAGTGPAGGTASGAPGGMTSDVRVSTLGVPFRGSGGAGAEAVLGGGNGGGGGGSIMLTAGGNLVTGNGQANGGNPTSKGGGGSGGIIVLRAGGDVTTGTMTLTGGGTAAAQGAAGLLRYDAGGTATLAGAPTGYRGPQFISPSLIVTTDKPMLQVSGTPQTMFQYFITNAAGTMTTNGYAVTLPDSGPATVVNGTDGSDRLSEGLNRICLVPGSAPLTSDTRNCIDIAYIAH